MQELPEAVEAFDHLDQVSRVISSFWRCATEGSVDGEDVAEQLTEA